MAIVKAEKARKDIPLVSIFAVCYNHSKYVVETLDSILNQTYENIELVIIDSNSPDNSVEVIQNWIDEKGVECTLICQKEPKNVCQNFNEGLELIHGKYYQGLSCDDILFPDKIEHQVSIMENNPCIGLVFGNAVIIDENSMLNGGLYYDDNRIHYAFTKRLLFEELENGDFIPACSMLININCQRAIGLYDIEIGVEDWDFLLRIAQSQWEMHYEYKLYSFYRRLNNSLWNIKNESMLINTLKAYLKHQIWKKNDSVLNYYRKFKYLNLTQKSKVGIFLFSNKRYDLMFFYCLYQIPVIKILTQRLYKKYMIS